MSVALRDFNLTNHVHNCLKDNQNTKDTPTLFKKKNHSVFLYSKAPKSFENSAVDTAYTKSGNFIMYIDKFNNKPAILPTDDSDDLGGHVKGTLYVVPPEFITYLDLLYTNGVQYIRVKTDVYLKHPGTSSPFKPENTWVYVGRPAHFANKLPDKFDIANKYTRKKDKSFQYFEHIKRARN